MLTFLSGRKELSKDARELTFAVERIQEMTVSSEGFAYPADYVPEKRFLQGFGLVQHDKTESIRLRFAPLVASGVASRRWHPSQEVTTLPSGELDVRMELEIGTELVSWIQSFGPFVQVLEPQSLILRVVQAAQKTLALYSQEARNPVQK